MPDYLKILGTKIFPARLGIRRRKLASPRSTVTLHTHAVAVRNFTVSGIECPEISLLYILGMNQRIDQIPTYDLKATSKIMNCPKDPVFGSIQSQQIGITVTGCSLTSHRKSSEPGFAGCQFCSCNYVCVHTYLVFLVLFLRTP